MTALATVEPVLVHFSPAYCDTTVAFDTTRKAAAIAASLDRQPIRHVRLVEPVPVTREQLLAVHSRAYVDAVLTGEPRALAVSNELPGWDEESWYAQLQVARLVEILGDQPAAIAGYLDAYARRPSRAEPLVELARLLRARGDWPGALLYARAAAQIPLPADRLFVDTACYQWRALDEWTIAAWWAGCHAEGAQAMTRLLAAPFPESERARIDTNAGYYRERGFLSGA